ncbi:hypothetical protein BV898_14790 [Hypsibius exemplaris]|uniref:Uncharacterized protein n=1 Tax=Hypsibius exemplaris TaxID=2072580 RepID=A0A9X6RJM5_HYPEX|nr:hypothetical protein BV898_14790 [Hypsibius exemplaris]
MLVEGIFRSSAQPESLTTIAIVACDNASLTATFSMELEAAFNNICRTIRITSDGVKRNIDKRVLQPVRVSTRPDRLFIPQKKSLSRSSSRVACVLSTGGLQRSADNNSDFSGLARILTGTSVGLIRRTFRWTLSAVGRLFNASMKAAFGETDIEQLWIPYCTATTDLTSVNMRITDIGYYFGLQILFPDGVLRSIMAEIERQLLTTRFALYIALRRPQPVHGQYLADLASHVLVFRPVGENEQDE